MLIYMLRAEWLQAPNDLLDEGGGLPMLRVAGLQRMLDDHDAAPGLFQEVGTRLPRSQGVGRVQSSHGLMCRHESHAGAWPHRRLGWGGCVTALR